jgi:hypothetical protein
MAVSDGIHCSVAKVAENEKAALKKLKHAKIGSPSVCNDEFKKGFHPTVVIRRFFATDSKSTLASNESFDGLIQNYTSQCPSTDVTQFEKSFVDLKWRYQFLESAHCIRIELDLGNLTHFKSLFNYSYYMFSYRELSRRNNHLKRQPIADQLNSLTIHRVKIKPYIVCVTFYSRVELNLTRPEGVKSNETTDAVMSDEEVASDCAQYTEFFRSDDRHHDTDLCLDIDTQHHFLNFEEYDHHESISRELVMVIFIMCLVAGVLGIVTLAHYMIVAKPTKARMRKVISDYIRKKQQQHATGTNNTTNNNTNLNSAAGSHNSLSKDKHASGPTITVTDCSSQKALAASSSKINSNAHDEGRESEPLLNPSFSATGHYESAANSQVNSGFTPVVSSHNNKVKFHVGETIVEESPSSSQLKLATAEGSAGTSGNEPVTVSGEPSASGSVDDQDAGTDQNEECIKSISHLLDDKPWLSSSQSQSQLGMTRRDSRLGISAFNSNNEYSGGGNASGGDGGGGDGGGGGGGGSGGGMHFY